MGNLFSWFEERDRRNNPVMPPPRERIVLNPPTDRDQPMRPLSVQDILSRAPQPEPQQRVSLDRPDGLAPGLMGSGRTQLGIPTPQLTNTSNGIDYASNRPSLDNTYSPDNPPPAIMVPTNASPDNTTGMDYPAMPSRVSLAPDPLTQKRQQLSVLSDPTNPAYKKPEKAKGFWGKLGEVGREALIGAGTAYSNSSGTPQQRLAAAAGGAAAGGAAGGINPSLHNQRIRLGDIEQTKRQISELERQREEDASNYYKQQQGMGQQIKNAKEMRDLQGEPYWHYIDKKEEITQQDADVLASLGYPKMSPASWKKFKDTTVNGQTFSRPENDPNYKLNTSVPTDPTEVPQSFDVGNGVPLQLTSKQVAPIFAGQATANANRELTASTSNANRQLEADRANASARARYYSDKLDLQKAALAPFAKMLESNESLQAQFAAMGQHQSRMQVLQSQLDQALASGSDQAQIRQLQSKFDAAQKDFANAETDFGKALGSFKGAEAAKQAFDSINVPEPVMVKPGKVTSPKVSGRQIPKGKDPLGLFR